MRVKMTHKTEPHAPVMITNLFNAEGRLYAHANIYGTNFTEKQALETIARINKEPAYSHYTATLET